MPNPASFPADVLNAQIDWRCLPVEYLASWASTSNVETEAVLQSVLRGIVDPPTPRQLRAELLATGDFTALTRSLASNWLRQRVGTDFTERLLADVRRHWTRVVGRERERLKEYMTRYKHLEPKKTHAWIEASLAETAIALEASTRDQTKLAELRRRLEDIDRYLSDAEAQELEFLEERFAKVTAEHSERFDAIKATREAIEDRRLERAKYLLNHAFGGTWSPPPEAIPYRGSIRTDGDADLVKIVSWLKGERPTPPSFQRMFGIRADDVTGAALLAAIVPFVVPSPTATSREFVRLVEALERALGVDGNDGHVASTLKSLDGVRFARLRGLRIDGLYGFEDEAYDRGVVVACAVASGPERDVTGNGAPNDIDEIVAPDEMVIAIGGRSAAIPSERVLTLEWDTLLAHAGDTHRRHNLARIVGAQMHADEAFPDASHGSGILSLCLGRDSIVDRMLSGKGPALWIGPKGSGKTATLRSLMKRARTEQFGILRLQSPDHIDTLSVTMSESGADDGVREYLTDLGTHRLLILLDDADELDVTSPGTGLVAVALLESIRRQEDPRIVSVCVADPQLVGAAPGPPWELLQPLGPGDSRSMMLRLLDLNGGVADDRALHALVYFAGGHPRMIHLLLRHLRKRLARLDQLRNTATFWKIDLPSVQSLVATPEIREAARDILLAPLTAGDLRKVFAAALYRLSERPHHEGIGVAECQAVLHKEASFEIDDVAVAHQLRCLEALYLLTSSDDRWYLPDSGIGQLLLDDEVRKVAEEELMS